MQYFYIYPIIYKLNHPSIMLSYAKVDSHHEIKLHKFTDSFNKQLCTDYMQYFQQNDNDNNDKLANILKTNNLTTNYISLSNPINYDTLETCATVNPIFIINNNDQSSPQVDSIIYEYANAQILNTLNELYIDTSSKITYSSFTTNNFDLFNDLVILTRFNSYINSTYDITLNLIGNFDQYIESITSSDTNIIDPSIMSSNPNILFTYRLIKFIEWFSCTKINLNINLYPSPKALLTDCGLNPSYSSNILLSINGINNPNLPPKYFKIFASTVCVSNGYMINLSQTKSKYINLTNHTFNIHKNINQSTFLSKYLNHASQINIKLQQLSNEIIEIDTANQSSNVLYIASNNMIQLNDKTYVYTGKLSSNPNIHIYETANYKMIQDEINAHIINYYDDCNCIQKQAITMCEVNSVYSIYFDMWCAKIADYICICV